MRFLVRLLINACALWVATQLVRGVTFNGDVLPFLGVALIFGVINATIRPVFKILTFPLIIVTLGIFALVVNGLMLWLTSRLSGAFGLGFHVQENIAGGKLRHFDRPIGTAAARSGAVIDV